MMVILIICVSMALMSGIFWVIEVIPVWKAVMRLQKPQWNQGISSILNPFKALSYFIKASLQLSKGKYFIADFTATVVLAGIFGLTGVIGTTMGLTISNVISIALLIAMGKEAHNAVRI